MGQVPPDKVDLFIATARKIAADLVAHPVSDDELERLLGSYKQAVARASSGNQFWLQQMDGAAYDPRIAAATLHLGRDLDAITAASLQAVAAKYLKPDKDWTMVVVPKKVAAGIEAARGEMAGE
jgi:zinc protease